MKKYLIILVALCGVILTGCAQTVDISNQESDMLAEYMAGVVLKQDSNYKEALLDLDNTQETEPTDSMKLENSTEAVASIETVETKEPTASLDSNSTKESYKSVELKQSEDIANYMSLTQDMGNNKFNIDYADYALCDSYTNDTDNNYFSLETSSDRKLLVVSFDVKNLSDKTESLNLIESGFKYQLDVNTGTIYQPMMTLLVNDLQYINLDIASGETKKAVIVFDVLRDIDLSNINLIISNQDKTTIIKLK